MVTEEEALDAGGDGLVSTLIRNACHSVELLERLVKKYPEAVAREARYHDCWPVLRRPQDRAVRESPAGDVLGKRYPLDSEAVLHAARKGSLRSYLTPLVLCLSYNHSFSELAGRERLKAAKAVVKGRANPWDLPFGVCPPLAAEVLLSAADLPPLRKASAVQWAEKLVVPFIMVTDAANLEALKEPALKAIGKQRGVKSMKTFRSRLLDAVRRELPRMARG